LKYDGLYPNINRVTTLQNNHDTDRFMSLPNATLEGAMLHTAFTLSTRGIPQLYYGEEIAMTGGHDPDNRKDFPGGWREDSVNKFAKEGRTADEQKMFEWAQRWILLRRENKSLKEGKTIDLFYDNNVYVFARKLGQETFVLAFNNSNEPTRSLMLPALNIGVADGSRVEPRIGIAGVSYVKNGEFGIFVNAKSVVAYEIIK